MMGKKGLISVTTIVGQLDKPALKSWANTIGLKGISISAYFSETAEAGKIAHQYILSRLGGPNPTTRFDKNSVIGGHVARMLAKFEEWVAGRTFETHFIEKTFESAHGYYGRLDWAGILDGKRTVLDIKSADDVYQESCLQLAGYRELLVENGWPVERAVVLLVPREKEDMPVTPIEISDELLEAGAASFMELLTLYRTLQPLRSYFSARGAQKKKDKKEAA
jgi:hypothetical protein